MKCVSFIYHTTVNEILRIIIYRCLVIICVIIHEPRPFFFLILDCEAIGTAATLGLLCQPRVIMKMTVEMHMECRLAG
jgi:hypothetical protein